jgi:outer membrane receptor protein involved in Fe transport
MNSPQAVLRNVLSGLLLIALPACPTIFSNVRCIVHDPSHRPIAGAEVSIRASDSQYVQTGRTGEDGAWEVPAVPAGEYVIRVSKSGFADQEQAVTLNSNTAPILHFQLALATQNQSVTVSETRPPDVDSTAPVTTIDRREIEHTPGADLTNSLNMITDYVPGAYMTHDQLHVRGGHQVTWAVDGVPIPNTNIASNVGPQIDPKDIDTLEIERGGYSAQYGDRTYGIFNVVPRTGFENNREIRINATAGTFGQTNDQISVGSHTERFAYFASMDGNRSDYGLETPGPQVIHDRAWGLGAFGSLIFNVNPADQLRFIASSRGDDYQIPDTPDDRAAGVRDVERERDLLTTFTWVHTFSPGLLFTAAPFVHVNRAHYDGDPQDTPLSTTQHLDSTYAGAQIALNSVTRRHNARIGLYGFGEREHELVHLIANDGSGDNILAEKRPSGAVAAAFLEDQVKLAPRLTLTGGLRLTHYAGTISENAADPRVGIAFQIPHLKWVLRGFYGAYYQAPPLSTVSGPLLDFAVAQGLGIIPLRGERDEENQVGLVIPLHGWAFELNSFRLRATNYFDHNALGNSNVFFPVSIAGARIWGEELTVRSPRLFKRGEVSLAYSHQHAEGEGAITGGLTDFSPPAQGYFLLDHDQRHTLHANGNFNLPWQAWFAASLYYGSGFTNGAVDFPAHLQPHVTFDLSLQKNIGENLSLSLNALNAANRRFLLDNSQTFGGTHYADPRQIWLQLRYQFHF